jgi:hypothetical protein
MMMGRTTRILWILIGLLCCSMSVSATTRLMFELGPVVLSKDKHAHGGDGDSIEGNHPHGHSERCISEWFIKDVITAGVYRLVEDLPAGYSPSGTQENGKPTPDAKIGHTSPQNPHTRVLFELKDQLDNRIHRDLEVSTQPRQFVFTPLMTGEHDFCFHHILASPEFIHFPDVPYLKKIVEFTIKSPHDVFNVENSDGTLYADLKPIDFEIEKISVTLDDIAKEMDSLKEYEHGLRELNEQIYTRVKFLGIAFTVALVSVSVWQLVYLRRLFHIKKIM